MSTRFDYRSESTFKKDIFFGTKLEKYFFNKWLDICSETGGISITSWADNGCGNDGKFIAKGNTAGADYSICGSIEGGQSDKGVLKNEPLEIKWVPTAGKFTLKENDLKSYVREGASILFIYNSVNCGTNLRKPRDYDFDSHIKLVESKSQQIKWGIMWSPRVKDLYEYAKENNLFQPVYYMGNKRSIILKQKDFSKWFTSYNWL